MDLSYSSIDGKNRHCEGIYIFTRHQQPLASPPITSRVSKGFSLIEVLVAISIMMGGMLVVGLATSSNSLRIRKTAFNNNVATLLERKITEIEALYEGKSLEEIPDEDSGDFGPDFKQYRWQMASQEFTMPDLSSVLISRQEGANDMLLSVIKQTQEFISKSVKEVTISIFVKTAIKEVEYSVTTYFVNYDQELTLNGGGG